MPTGETKIELNDDPRFQERLWTVERVAWVLLAALILAALLGFTGSGGPFGRSSAASGPGEIDYPLVARWAAPERIEVTALAGEPLTVSVDRAFLELFQIEGVVPEPTRSAAGPAGITYAFETAPGVGGTATVTLAVKPLRPSLGARVGVAVGDGVPARLGVVVLP